ncbi:MAG TPA: hypothetical protein VGL00_19055 [Terracidiphilus sp.]|jgi:hypothetical protein
MSFESVQKIADAVLFEGYILYPYRPTSTKNRQRWNFGTLYPREFAQAQQPEEPWSFHSEMIVEGVPESTLDFRIRLLQLVPAATKDTGELDQGEWDQGAVRSWTLSGLRVSEILRGMHHQLLAENLATEAEPAGELSFPAALSASLTLHAEVLSTGVYRVSATLSNETPRPGAEPWLRRTAGQSAFTSAHLLVHVEEGALISLLDPPANLAAFASTCNNRGVFPVLAGDPGSRSEMLCSPIILYDYPQIAAESAGDFFDGTEMDEMLALRVLTLSDAEKQEIRRGDPYARRILERTESLPEEHLLKVHGALRGMAPPGISPAQPVGDPIQPWNPFEEKPPLDSITVFGVELRKGDRVRVWPQKRADIMDMAIEGRTAIIEAIEQDLEDNVQLAIVLEDDPGKDLGMLRQPGHRFFFSPEEVEPIKLEVS